MMPLILADRVQEISTVTGVADFVMDSTVPSFQSFDAAIGTGNTCYYSAVHSTSSLDEWEVGVGTMVGPATLQRSAILSSSNSGNIVNFSAGVKTVFVTLPASRAVFENASGEPPYPTVADSVAVAIVMG
jgi:hypothetical protein